MTQFYKLTLDRAIEDYNNGLITATGLLRYYLKIRYAPGWKIRLNPAEICTLLGFTKATFYKALAKLKKLGQATISKLNLIPITLADEENLATSESEINSQIKNSPIVNSQSPIREKESPIVERQSPIRDKNIQSQKTTLPKPNINKNSSDSPDVSSDSYQIFLNSLSIEQREKFFNFCKAQANQLPKPPILIKKWAAYNWEELRSLWYKNDPNVAYTTSNVQQSDWYNHPRFNRWKRKLECQYDARYFVKLIKNGGTKEERKAFARWAIENEVVKVPEGVVIEEF